LGIYLPKLDEKIVKLVKAEILTRTSALKLKAKRNFKDIYEKVRKAGDEWLVTQEMSDSHIPDENEKLLARVDIIKLNNR